MQDRSRWTASLLSLSATFIPFVATAAPLVAAAPEQDLRMEVRRSGAASASGMIRYQGVDYTFTADLQPRNDGFELRGALIDEGERVPFVATLRGDRVSLSADGEHAEMHVVEIGEFGAPTRAPPSAPTPRNAKRGALPKRLNLTQRTFKDLNMNGMPAYTQLVPKGWSANGHVEWSGGATPQPQRKILIKAPNGVSLQYVPVMAFEFVELSPQAIAQIQQSGQPMPPMPQPNIPPPSNIGQWIADFVSRSTPGLTNMRVTSAKRDAQAEQILRQYMGGQDTGLTWHNITLEYAKKGRAFRADVALGYQVLPMTAFTAGRAATWNVFVEVVASYPVELYDAYRPLVSTIMGSQRTTPQWFAAKTTTLGALAQQRNASWKEVIRRNGEAQRRATDQQMAQWKKQQAIQDDLHRKSINTIRDTEDYGLPGGGSVNLPSTYDHVYQTSNGDYVLSDAPIEGASLTPLSRR